MRNNIYQRSNGYYYFRKKVDGKMYRKSLRTKNKKKAENRAQKLERKIYHNIFSGKDKVEDLNFQELFERFLEERYFNSEATKKAYKKAVEMKKHMENCNDNSKRYVWRHLNTIYNWGMENNYVSENPYEDKPTTSKPNVKFYSKEEQQKILGSLEDDKYGDIIRFAFKTGARLGELTTLSKKRVNKNNILFDGKTGLRPFPITDEIRDLIDRGKIFEFETTNQVRQALYRRGVSATKIRHTFATRLVKNGYPIYRVSKLLGHSSVSTTERYYAHFKPSEATDYGKYLD